ncbi:MAG: two-component regulator propeller domain-containing protein, partial [Saprospiraceae bacterium]
MFFLPVLSFAQSLQLTTLTEEDGLSSNAQWSTSAICEDSFGFVWFGTLGGLDRYDGYELKSYRGIQNNNRDISNNRITAIAECGKGDLLLGTEEEGLIYFNREKEVFTAQQDIVVAGDTLTLRQINAIRKRGNDELIIASAFQGIFLYHIASGEFSEIVVDNPSFSVKSTNNLIVLKDQRLAIVSFNGVFVESNSGSFDFFEIDRINYLKYIIELPDGNILVRATNRSEEYVLNLKTSEVLQIKSSNKTPNCSGIVDKNGDLWLSNASGELFKKNGGILGSYLAQVERKGTYFPICMQHMLVSDNGNIYYTSYTGAGSFKFSEPLIKPYLDEEITIF